MNRIFRIFLIAALLISLCAFASAETYGSSQTDPIIINKPGKNVTITLDGVSITGDSSPAIKIEAAKSVTIILADGSENFLEGDYNCAGIDNNGIPLTITCESAGKGHTCDSSCGKLTARGGRYGAGIGSGFNSNASKITISGGNIIAKGSHFSAGIGGGECGNASGITISGGNVTATSGSLGAGIGGGSDGDASGITISGGNVTATSAESGAGIGSGDHGDASKITISGGNVTATSAKNGAGIGSGNYGNASGITISKGKVTATGGHYGAGIGSGYNGNVSDITISGSVVTATGSDFAAGIGAGNIGSVSGITISGGMVTAFAGTSAQAVGGSVNSAVVEDIVIAPKYGSIDAIAGADKDSAAAIEGSPFTSGSTDITDLVAGKAFFQTIGPVPTGDTANLILWVSALAAGMICLISLKKRAHA